MAKAAQRSGTQLMWDVAHLAWSHDTVARFRGGVTAVVGFGLVLALASYHAADPSFDAASGEAAHNLLGGAGANLADLAMQLFGLAAWVVAVILVTMGLARAADRAPAATRGKLRLRAVIGALGVLALAGVLAAPAPPAAWPLAKGLGGLVGDGVLSALAGLFHFVRLPGARFFAALILAAGGVAAFAYSLGLRRSDAAATARWIAERNAERLQARDARAARQEREARAVAPPAGEAPAQAKVRAPKAPRVAPPADEAYETAEPSLAEELAAPLSIRQPKAAPRPSGREARETQKSFDFAEDGGFQLPELAMLAKPKPRASAFDEGALRQNARLLESVLAEFGVRGQIDQIRPGPVVTLYELVPAAGVKSARVVALSDDIARSMSVAACRVAVVPGRNAIGIELPNARRETVYLRDLLASAEFEKHTQALPLALGENIGGEPYIADLAKMPHLLIAGTTGSGKSVGVNAMILSILYRLRPDQCRFIMIDPKMLELSVYDGIPHLLAPVVTDPKKAIVALKWTVREMEDRYRRMSKIGVRNVAGYNEKAVEAAAKGEHFVRTVQTGFDEAGRPIYEEEKLRPEPMPYLVVVIDEVADLMLVAGKDIEGAVQRLAQMARAAGIHLIMATQRPSVDVITGTIKANFPTRISFQVTSKIDARTILGEQGAEQLLGQGDMLYMAGGGRITRLHGPFVSDGEVEAVAKYLRLQGEPQYLEDVTSADDEDGDGGFDGGGGGGGGESADLYDHAVAVVTRDRKASTSYIQRRLQIGYNRAASLMERMEREGVVGPANHAGKREILAGPPPPG
ncbi:DNA translocase FtsK 4TM domain-containing protein [Caulobacter sp. KR2-114]|uniref:FtsK/SpoIIIE family DNA translocase n=1 Tax=Caulobacter sp. KR2-114 TaxID=3400912 RepID=UPI003C03DC22